MKKTTRRILALLLALVSVFMLAACAAETPATPGTTDTPATDKPAEDKPAADTPAAETPAEDKPDPFGKYEEPITINVVRVMESTTQFNEDYPETKSLTDNIWSKTYEEQLGIKLNYLWTPPSEEYATKWTTAMASNDLPDMGWVDANTYLTLVEAGLVEDMTDYFEDYASDYYKAQVAAENYVSYDFMTFDGRLLGLPVTGATPEGANFLYIRKDWMDAVGADAPTTIPEVIGLAKKFMEAKLGGEDTYGICMGPWEFSGQCDWEGFLNGYGAYYNIWIKGDDGKLVYGTTEPEMREAVLGLQDLYNNGIISQEFAVNPDITQDLVSGKVGICYGTYWAPIMAIQSNINTDPNAEWIALEIPTLDGSPAVSQAWGNGAPSQFFFVRKGYEHPEAAVKIINLGFKLDVEEPTVYNFHEPSQIQVHAYRLIGMWEPWRNLNNNKPVWEALETGDASIVPEVSLEMYNNILKYREGTLEREKIGYMLINTPEDSTYAYLNDMWAEDRILLSEYKTIPTQEFSQTLTELDIKVNEAIVRVMAGEDISVFDKAVQEWWDFGGEDLTAEVNEWYANK